MKRNSTRLFFVLFLAITVVVFASSGSAYFSTQNLRYNTKYECNGETIVVGHCRSDDDRPGMARTQPSADYCMVYYPSRPKRGGSIVQEAELRADVLSKLTACNALTPPEPASAPTTQGDESAAQAEYERGRKYFAAKDYERAAAAFKRAIAIEPASAPYTNLGNSYRALDRNEEAAAAYKEALRLKPDNAVAYFGLGAADNELKLYEPAVKAFREALRLEPKYPNASNQLGLSYLYLKRYQDAVTAFEDAIRLKPDDADALFNLGYLQSYTGHQEEALQLQRRLETVDRKKAQELLNEINKPRSRREPG
jgi:tetratricopeptide (TPR) repeat protein